jgi:tRNA U34 5-carboxymethylaminomethyl modifying enzyme MnmG/GidA
MDIDNKEKNIDRLEKEISILKKHIKFYEISSKMDYDKIQRLSEENKKMIKIIYKSYKF